MQACKIFRERHIRIDPLYHRKEGYFPGRELYFFHPSGNRTDAVITGHYSFGTEVIDA